MKSGRPKKFGYKLSIVDAHAPDPGEGLPPPELVVIDSPYRLVLMPILNYVLQVVLREAPYGRKAARTDL